MLAVRRLIAVGAVLALAGILAGSQLWGESPGRDGEQTKNLHGSGGLRKDNANAGDRRFAENLGLSRFSDKPLVLYRTEEGETLMALQVKPQLAAAPARPRDYLILIDTSASKADGQLETAQRQAGAMLGDKQEPQGPLATARRLTRTLLPKLDAQDRVALWTLNTRTHDLTGGFQPCNDMLAAFKELQEESARVPDPKPFVTLDKALAKAANSPSAHKLETAFKALDKEYPAGAVNLKEGLAKAADGFDGRPERQRVIVFMGDGKSIAGPIDDTERAKQCRALVKNEIAFYSVPLGTRMEPLNLHGFPNGTGGKVVRVGLSDTPEKWAANLIEAVKTPILYGAQIQLPAEVVEASPSKLPPLRPDVPTLVVGKIKPGARLDYTLTGTVAGNDVKVQVSEKVPAPDVENFFLVNMVEQWRAQRDRPALIQADRALAYAFETNQVARADLLAKADWALEQKKFDVAVRLFQQAQKADPTSQRARAGQKLAENLRDGKVTSAQLAEQVKAKAGDITRIENGRVIKLSEEQLFADPEKKDNPLAPDQGGRDPQAEVRARQEVADQQARGIVDDAIRQAQRLVQTDPDAAHDFLKRTLDGVRSNPDITNRAKAALADRLERALQQNDIRGAIVKRDQNEALNLLAAANARRTLSAQERVEQDRVRERMRVFHNLMDQAREQEAYRLALSIRVDLINQGLPVPPAVTAGYQIGLSGYHLREEQELRRLREERFLAVMLQVEKSHVPFPDEPPVEFPPSAVWKELSERRKARYESSSFGADMPKRGIELQRKLSDAVKFPGFDDPKTTLTEALDALAKRYDLSFDINEKAFKFEQLMDVGKTEIASPNPIPEMNTTLSTVLRKILAKIPSTSGATYLIRRDVIEITTLTFAGAEKVVRVYPVADLVIPIPNAVNTQSILNQATIFGLSAGALGGFGGIGGLGGGLGALGLGGLGLGGLGGLGLAGFGGLAGLAGLGGIAGAGNLGGLGGIGGLAGIGGGGFNQLGAQGGAIAGGGFQGNFQGAVNLGVGGGVVGFGGGQLGQFGNLGGQFGLQGGNQSQILITVIRQVVGRPKDWAIQYDPVTGQPLNPLDDNQAEGLNQENNQLGFYPPAMALVVKASSTIHSKPSNLVITGGAAGAGAAALPGERDPKVRVAGQGDERPDDKDPKKKIQLDPRTVWQEALVKGVDNPALIIATADFLALNKKWDHAAEFLKANLRQGIVVKPWVYKSLAIALRESNAPVEEIERAEVSSADLEPLDAPGFLEAARALAQDKNYERALAFCRQAALLQPGVPHAYEDALGYAELARDSKAMEWAAGHLLRQDWPANNSRLQARALQKVEALAKLLEEGGRKDEAQTLRGAVASLRQRDLVIKLRWQGEADCDLHVYEPTGSTCWALARQTIGGGVLIGDSLADMTGETYLAAEAFPGEYVITVEKVWGRALNDKVQLRIIRHQGTPEETEQLLTVELKSRQSQPIKIKLADGRRKETAYVAPPELQREEAPAAAKAAVESPDRVLHQLRALADPEVTGVSKSFQAGTSGLPAQRDRQVTRKPSEPSSNDRTLYQTRVKPLIQDNVSVTAQAVISADRRYVRLSMTPFFSGVTGVAGIVPIGNPTIPGPRR
jgi:hypothetical protein